MIFLNGIVGGGQSGSSVSSEGFMIGLDFGSISIEGLTADPCDNLRVGESYPLLVDTLGVGRITS